MTPDDGTDRAGFIGLLERVKSAWEGLDAEAAVECFSPDAVYMEPPDIQLFVGHDQLRSYFSPLVEGTKLHIHAAWFDPSRQTGALEYSFGVEGRETAVHGVAVIVLEEGRIASWREYQRKGPASFERFIATTGKEWEWHTENYP